jgi:hypothetical protein
MKHLKLLLAGLLLVVTAAVAVPALQVSAQGPLDDVCQSNGDSAVCNDKNNSSDDFVATLVDTLIFIVGFLAVFGIIIGGILYVTSSGDSSNVTKAKNTILYSIVGLVVAILGYAIVRFVIQLF